MKVRKMKQKESLLINSVVWELIKGLERGSFTSEQEIMNVPMMQEN